MVDRDLVLRKLAALDEYAGQLEEYRALTVEQYRADWKAQRIVERTLQMAIEACADVANHLIADRRLRVPTTYAEAFEILGEAGILDASLKDTTVRMARFRNIVVHDYTRIDPAVVVRILREDLADLSRFKDAVLGLL